MAKFKLVNEDGTKFDPPKNPLIEKWDVLYPPTRHGEPCGPVIGYFEDGREMMNYSCVICRNAKCRHSDSWRVPEEDKEAYNDWMREYEEYINKHNPCFKEKIISLLED